MEEPAAAGAPGDAVVAGDAASGGAGGVALGSGEDYGELELVLTSEATGEPLSRLLRASPASCRVLSCKL